jgi:hypothetical protein
MSVRVRTMFALCGAAGILAVSGSLVMSSAHNGQEVHPPSCHGGSAAVGGMRVVGLINRSSSLGHCGADTVIEDKRGLYWINCDLGLAIYDEATDRWTKFGGPPEEDLRLNHRLGALVTSTTGDVWAISLWDLSYFDGQWHHLKRLNVSDHLATLYDDVKVDGNLILAELDAFRVTFPSATGKMWFVRNGELRAYEGGQWTDGICPPETVDRLYLQLPVPGISGGRRETRLQTENRNLESRYGPKNLYVQLAARRRGSILTETYCGIEDRDLGLWLGTDRAIVDFNPASHEWKVHPLPKGLVEAALVYEDRKGGLWFSDRFGNVAVYQRDSDQWTVYRLSDYVADQEPKAGSSLTGPQAVTLPSFNHTSRTGPKTTVPPFVVNSIFHDQVGGGIMFGTENGLVVFDDELKTWRLFTTTNSCLPSNRIQCLMEDHLGRIWIGTSSGVVVAKR